MKYLLDTNICIFYLKGKFNLANKFKKIEKEACYISEITVAELKYGAEHSENPSKTKLIVNELISQFQIIPIYSCLDYYAKEKSRLRKSGIIIDDFDLLIGATSISENMIMVTNNIKHLGRLKNIKIEDWTI
jgi:tRNA(fMet)-specific endonuclease VapC